MRGNIGGMNTKSQMIIPLKGEDLKSTGFSKLGFGGNRESVKKTNDIGV